MKTVKIVATALVFSLLGVSSSYAAGIAGGLSVAPPIVDTPYFGPPMVETPYFGPPVVETPYFGPPVVETPY